MIRPLATLRRWAGRSAADAAAQPVLAGYRRSSTRLVRVLLYFCLVIACIAFGLAFGIVAPARMMPFTVPAVIVSGLILWCLPPGEYAPTKALEPLYLAFF